MQRTPLALATLAIALGSATLAPAASGTHGDGSYDLPNWFEWLSENPVNGAITLDVVILPAEHGQVVNGNGVLGGTNPNELTPCDNSYTLGTQEAVADWIAGIQAFGASWIQTGLAFRVFTLGCDDAPPPSNALTDAEIVVFSDENKLVILGVAFSTRPCLVNSSKFFVTSFTYNDFYNVMSQEFGHCLGLDHVEASHPVNDVMNGNYPYNPGMSQNPKNCVSNLDVLAVEEAFEEKLGQGTGGATASVAVGQYQQQAC